MLIGSPGTALPCLNHICFLLTPASMLALVGSGLDTSQLRVRICIAFVGGVWVFAAVVTGVGVCYFALV